MNQVLCFCLCEMLQIPASAAKSSPRRFVPKMSVWCMSSSERAKLSSISFLESKVNVLSQKGSKVLNIGIKST